MKRPGLVRRISKIVDEYEVIVNRRRRPKKGKEFVFAFIFYEQHRIEIYTQNHKSFGEMVLSLIHEWIHAAFEDLPEYLNDEALDKIAFTSPKLRWLAAEKLGDATFFGGKR